MIETLGLGPILGILAIAFFALLFFVANPATQLLGRLFAFLLLVGVTAVLGYMFWTEVLDKNPNPFWMGLAKRVTQNRFIDLTEIVPGIGDMDDIHLVDTDGDDEPKREEWLVFYRYDVATAGTGRQGGPYGAAIYDYDKCRPPSIQAFELTPRDYDYLGQDDVRIHKIENIIKYKDPRSIPYDKPNSPGLDRPELIISGYTGRVLTDLNIFRKVGTEPNCLEIQAWRHAHPGQPFPYSEWLSYENLGSFRGNYRVTMNSDNGTVTVWDRGGFERSQFTIRQMYRPDNSNGTYYDDPVTKSILDPVEKSLDFGPGQPDAISQVYYPEKTVLAFYLSLGKDKEKLTQAESYLTPEAQKTFPIKTDPFGLSMAKDSVARARDKLARVLVWEIRYDPDIEAEQLHQERVVSATVVGVDAKGEIDREHSCYVTWHIKGIADPLALPYGCQWKLDWYESTCEGPVPKSSSR